MCAVTRIITESAGRYTGGGRPERQPATWLAGRALVSRTRAARAKTRPIITTTGPAVAAAARCCGRSAMVARIAVSFRRVALTIATAGVAPSRPAAIAAAEKAASVFVGM